MTSKLFIGKYTKEEIKSILAEDGYTNCFEFDGNRYNADSTNPYPLGISDVILYHLAGFMTILEKHQATQLDTRPIVLCGITERMDENNPLSSYLSKMKKYGRDIYVFASNNDEVTRGLFFAVRGVICYKDESEGDE